MQIDKDFGTDTYVGHWPRERKYTVLGAHWRIHALVSISLDALQTVRRGFFFLLIGKNSSKLQLETIYLMQIAGKGNETHTALHC